MGKLCIQSSVKLKGNVLVPPSKSLSHRAIICASLCCEGKSTIDNIILSDDIKATISSMEALGAKIDIQQTHEDRCKLIISRNNTYINNTDESKARWDLICLAMRSIADTCIIPVQDYLGLGPEARINIPSTVGMNWTWRMKKDCLSKKMIMKIKMLTKLYGRI